MGCRRWRRVLAAVWLLGFGAAARGQVREDAAIRSLQAWLDGSRTLEARFEQTLISGAFGSGLEERGRLYVEKPRRLRWDYLGADPKIALVIGDRTLLYLPEDRQLIRGSIQAEHAVLPDLLAGKRRLDELFDVKAVRSDGAPEGGSRIELRPKDGDGAFVRVILTLDARSSALEEAEILDSAGNRTRFRFAGWRRNRDLPAGVFAFEPPAGTEIVEAD